MAIDSVYDKDHRDEETVAFPWIGLAKGSGLFVLFIAPSTGTCLRSGNASWEVGEVLTTWDMSQFTPLPKGECLILRNKWELTNADA